MDQISLAQRKFESGKNLTRSELLQLKLLDRCRYVVEKFFSQTGEGFSTHEVTVKLIELDALGGSKAPDVHRELVGFYGQPGGENGSI